VGEVTIEEAGMRVSVRRTPEQLDPTLAAVAAQPAADGEPLPPSPQPDGFVRVEAPMVGVFYRAPQPGAPPFVQEGDTVAQGQTLCILEAMKLMNEIKADAAGIVRTIHVGNAEPVEFGQLLFELEPVGPPPLDAV
jgi:acetyl-CoA carboxylase biotin carboxyl carrier protein